MKQAQLFNKVSGDLAVRFTYMTFDGEEWLGAYGEAMWVDDFKRYCKTALARHKNLSDYEPYDIRCLVAHFSDGRQFIWQAPSMTRFGTWTKTWQQVTDAEPWEPLLYGILPF